MPVIRMYKNRSTSCGNQPNQSACCCSGTAAFNMNEPSCCGEKRAPVSDFTITTVTGELTWAERWDHFLARWGWKRGEHRVTPGLYALGSPDENSPVFVTSNYSLSFDTLRSSLKSVDGWILVLDTKGINVWCAAGKGTFSTAELLRQIERTMLQEVVRHRQLILPQLGAPGVSAHEIKKHSGFQVKYGPIRAVDLPQYLETGIATPEMRQVRFPLRDRIALIPIELVNVFLPMLAATIILWLLSGPLAALGALAAVMAGAALFPILLPWLPTKHFSSKGFLLGWLTTLPFVLAVLWTDGSLPGVIQTLWALAFLLWMPPITAYLALNFTGSTTFTSKTGVKREMRQFIPIMVWTFSLGILITIGLSIYNILV